MRQDASQTGGQQTDWEILRAKAAAVGSLDNLTAQVQKITSYLEKHSI